MMSSESPQYAALLFILTIYENDDLEETLTLTGESFGNILKAYHTNKSVQRHVLNLRLNDVAVEPVTGGFSPRSEYKKSASVGVKITGYFDNNKIIDLKTINMVKSRGDWKIIGVTNTVP